MTSRSSYFLNKPLKKLMLFSHSRRTRQLNHWPEGGLQDGRLAEIPRADLLEHTNQRERVKGLGRLAHVVQGVFWETVSKEDHIDRIRKDVALVRQAWLVEALFNSVRGSVGSELEYAAAGSNLTDEKKEGDRGWNRKELREWFVGIAGKDFGSFAMGVQCRFTTYEHTSSYMETMLLVFGKPDRHLVKVKTYACGLGGLDPEVGKGLITASPLDYHVSWQDIMGKEYPAFDPPKPLFPFELATNSFLLSSAINTASGQMGGNGDVLLGGKGVGENLGSILNKAVYIATPAPSPPLSPAGFGGKGEKKQNYQTPNNFQYLYLSPLLIAEGSGEVLTRIKEAGYLFCGRVGSILAMKQLWDEQEAFLKLQRGWEVDEEILKESKEIKGRDWRLYRPISMRPPMQPPQLPPPLSSQQVSFADKEDSEGNGQRGSVTIDPATRRVDYAGSSIRSSWNIFGTAVPGLSNDWEKKRKKEREHETEREKEREKECAEREADEKRRLDEADAQRIREITSKAISAILVGLLKWFRVSYLLTDVLKFERLNQQDVVQALTTKTDRKDMSFLNFCTLHSSHPKPKSKPPTNLNNSYLDYSPDEGCPPTNPQIPARAEGARPPTTPTFWHPTIPPAGSHKRLLLAQLLHSNKLHTNNTKYHQEQVAPQPLPHPVQVLRCPPEAVQGCIGGFVPVHVQGVQGASALLWLQVAPVKYVRLHLDILVFFRLELKDNWLSSGHVNIEVGESLPQEQVLRSLIHFDNVSRYPKSMGTVMEMMEMERDFFPLKIDKMEVWEWDAAGLEGWRDTVPLFLFVFSNLASDKIRPFSVSFSFLLSFLDTATPCPTTSSSIPVNLHFDSNLLIDIHGAGHCPIKVFALRDKLQPGGLKHASASHEGDMGVKVGPILLGNIIG
ncbi:hypothetical protein L873DRAFT_1793684 [Choiromyces venosus 120613-1]|uniref:Far11/STRP C-terminal domain-containing protein n=1 Tax=Choiromyces venosus 120613-1 TaxID=1336337 RepID=A0A3N4J8Q3_9PEZI|nr:hypothetical protein L873DRAFT_1793684 [Choiromyces venosus 120613-1]